MILSPQYTRALAAFAFSLSLPVLAFFTIQISAFFSQSNHHQPADFSSVCENTYTTHPVLAVPIEKDFIPT
jgi:peptidoglycan biosynthesis protein MviN/MurJ (putative lipid II flippase)